MPTKEQLQRKLALEQFPRSSKYDAGWCLSEYNNSRGCEVGIEVMEEHRRKGIGTALSPALVEEARKQGLQYVGWSCFKDSLASAATARKAGLSKMKEYKVITVQR